jgi:hypothetical protein
MPDNLPTPNYHAATGNLTKRATGHGLCRFSVALFAAKRLTPRRVAAGHSEAYSAAAWG